jgi:GNAT superfamily N-acetyltransferase
MEDKSFRLRPAVAADRAALEECFIQLQDEERDYEPNRVPGQLIAAPYLNELNRRCNEFEGQVIVAESDLRVVGFICVLARTSSGEMIEREQERAYITDLIVLPAWRRIGVGGALLAAAERFASSRGARVLLVGVLAANKPAHRLYQSAGFTDNEIVLRKFLQ